MRLLANDLLGLRDLGADLHPGVQATLQIASSPLKDLQGSSRAWDRIRSACFRVLVIRPMSSVGWSLFHLASFILLLVLV